MRIWDLNPGYLNRASLLGEHRELHGILAIIGLKRIGYARHPETMRWRGHIGALRLRHDLLAAEMALRGYRDRSPVHHRGRRGSGRSDSSIRLLVRSQSWADKYATREPGRIALPRSNQELWAAHKYWSSRATRRPTVDWPLRVAPAPRLAARRPRPRAGRAPPPAPSGGELQNAILHMWGHIGGSAAPRSFTSGGSAAPTSFTSLQRLAIERREPYLTGSTALSELAVWLPETAADRPDSRPAAAR